MACIERDRKWKIYCIKSSTSFCMGFFLYCTMPYKGFNFEWRQAWSKVKPLLNLSLWLKKGYDSTFTLTCKKVTRSHSFPLAVHGSELSFWWRLNDTPTRMQFTWLLGPVHFMTNHVLQYSDIRPFSLCVFGPYKSYFQFGSVIN